MAVCRTDPALWTGVPDDINVFELPGPSDEETTSGEEEVDDEDDQSDDGDEWIMVGQAQAAGAQEGRRLSKPKGVLSSRQVVQPKQKRKGDSANVFAAAEEYADLLNDDSAGEVLGSAAGPSRNRTKRRRSA
jgi:hypothetical protein